MAIKPLRPGLCATLVDLRIAGQWPEPQTQLATLIVSVSRSPQPFALVLEDYHAIPMVAIHDLVTYLLNHLPPTMHLVLSSRVDPPLSLARWRVRGDLTELRAADTPGLLPPHIFRV